MDKLSFRSVGVCVALGIGIGTAIFAATGEAFWIGIGAAVGAAMAAAVSDL